jgi:AmiR/NasT family two-component response regulator
MALTTSRFTSIKQPQSVQGEFMKSRLVLSVLFASALSVGAVVAQTAPSDLIAAYEAGVAGKVCKPKLDSAKSSALGNAVQHFEQKSGLAQADLDALWTKIQGDAKADAAGFCEKAMAEVDQVIKAAQ